MLTHNKIRSLYLGVFLILSFLVSACGDDSVVVNTKDKTDKAIEAKGQKTQQGEPIKQGKVAVVVPKKSQTVQDCLTINSALSRLSCFDQIFKTPLASTVSQKLDDKDANRWEQSSDKRVRFLASHLKKKQTYETTGLSYYAYGKVDDQTAGRSTGRLLLSVAAHTASLNNKAITDARVPALVFQCYQDISSVQLLWPNNLDQDQVDLRVWSDKKLLLDSTWRVIDEAFLVTSPRGLPGVDIIKRLLNYQQLTFESRTDGARFKASFHVPQLKQQITSLGKACHWL